MRDNPSLLPTPPAPAGISRLPRPLLATLVASLALLLGASCPFYVAVPVMEGLDDPVALAAPPGSDLLYAAQRGGGVVVFDPSTRGAALPFLDLSDRVSEAPGRGLRGLAFAPDFASSGRFYVVYDDLAGGLTVSRFHAADPELPADPASEERVLQVALDDSDHRGGAVAFGPHDGMLYLGVGDGDDDIVAQDEASLAGKLLRLDVSGGGPGYAIPADNPFVGQAGVRGEIWALGLHDPSRLSFDSLSGELWISDSGWSTRVEISRGAAGDGGLNYGWPTQDGSRCLRNLIFIGLPCESASNPNQFAFPVVEFDAPQSCPVVGSLLYRGGAAHYGSLLYVRGCDHDLRARSSSADMVLRPIAPVGTVPAPLTALAAGGFGEPYFLEQDGSVVRVAFEPPDVAPSPPRPQ